ncbi:hypothetical protein TIFTF001_012569 [Ficus carica]|uniref:Uncharacterized protein n=1 Tax=Ficus carica TaxID=3494 RepID=A0AA88ACJ3_FICCA|nr:hypothetical protein TIFTF001_012569 [Ficus carica]
MDGIVVVFDFDKTIIECNSDDLVVDKLGATDLFNQLLPTMPWNSLMTILEHLGMRECFSEINTNPSFVDEQGRLRIFPFHINKCCPHGWDLCPPNMVQSTKQDEILLYGF